MTVADLLQVLAGLLLVGGGVFCLVAAIGVVRLQDAGSVGAGDPPWGGRRSSLPKIQSCWRATHATGHLAGH